MMNERQLLDQLYQNLIFLISFFVLLVIGFMGILLLGNPFEQGPQSAAPKQERRQRSLDRKDDFERIENGIHVASGLRAAKGYKVVRANCTACHSAKLITQNRATREGWKAMIDWMQETQGLWSLGDKEWQILDYLAANYAPEEIGRRAALDEVEWYILELE